MLDFKHELHQLLSLEAQPLPQDERAEMAQAAQQLIISLNKKQTDFSMQMEELYDIVGNLDSTALQEALLEEKQRTKALVAAAVGLCDMLEDFCAYAQGSGDGPLAQQARMMWKNAGSLLERCGITRLGKDGQPLDPDIHSVQSASSSAVPEEHVARVLQSGYRYLGTVLRKAAVVVSKGSEEDENE